MEIGAEKRSELPAERDVLEKKNAAHHIAELQLDSKFLSEQVAHGGLLVEKWGKKRSTLKAEMQLTIFEMGFTTAWVDGTSKIDRGLKQ